MNRNELYLLHIRDALARVEEYIGVGRDRFMEETMRQDAVIRQLEIVGEATKRLSGHLLDSAPAIPWRRVASLRDRLIHAYAEVDLDRVWSVVSDDAPELHRTVLGLLRDLGVDEEPEK